MIALVNITKSPRIENPVKMGPSEQRAAGNATQRALEGGSSKSKRVQEIMVVCVKGFLSMSHVSHYIKYLISAIRQSLASSSPPNWNIDCPQSTIITIPMKKNQIIQCAWRRALKAKMNLAWWPSHTGLLTIPLVLHEWFQDQYRAEDDDNMANNSENGKIITKKRKTDGEIIAR